jgi:hypothetical protein
MQSWIPIPHSWREAIWLAIAIFIATRKGIRNGVVAFLRTWQTAPAEADKTFAEAESIRTQSAVNTAQLIREMSINLGQATMLGGQLKEKLASQQSSNALLQAENRQLKEKIEELEGSQARKA